jgi:hypothetical protein
VQIAAGGLFGIFSFDLGFEIDLLRAREALPEGVRTALKGGGGKISPAHVEYASPPLIQPLGTRRLLLIERPVDAEVSLRLHDFGAASIVFSMPFDGVDCASLPALTATLTGGGALEDEARAALADVMPKVRAAIARPNGDGAEMVEDYYVLQVSRFDPPLDPSALLGAERDLLARILHCEPARLSATETDEVLRTAVTYTPDDLVVTDWNVALVYDREYQDVLNVLELLNVQLLELRYLDRMLDTRIARLYEYVAHRRRLLSLTPAALRVRELSELRLDTASLRERMINALKLTGDLYLTKIYARTAERLHLAEWQRSLDGKLEVIQNVANVSASRAATTRAELLELTIIVLIAFEILLVLVGR